jgi:hypothetical protein
MRWPVICGSPPSASGSISICPTSTVFMRDRPLPLWRWHLRTHAGGFRGRGPQGAVPIAGPCRLALAPASYLALH